MVYERDELDLAYFETDLLAVRLRYGGDNNSQILFQIKDEKDWALVPGKKFDTDSIGFSQAIKCLGDYITDCSDPTFQWCDEQPAPEL